ncbi:MAG: hypothetical protein AB7P03_01800 [Kofleriaceae bacterium]
MAELTGEAARKLLQQIDDERLAELARARAEAERRGKEPFDVTKLREVAPSVDILRWSDATLTLHFEWQYYVHPDAMTLEQFAPLASHVACVLYEG